MSYPLSDSEQRALDVGHDGGDASVLQALCRRLLAEPRPLQTPDGTPIAPGVKLFFWSHNEPRHLKHHAIRAIEWSPGGIWMTLDGALGRELEECFGTREAAKAAEGGE